MAESGTIYSKRSGVYSSDEQGEGFKVDGSKPIKRDLSTKVSWWDLRPKRDIKSIPEGKKWCSAHDPLDDGGWVERQRFTDDSRYRDGKYPICNDCKARHARVLRALEREAQGQQVRPYRRHVTA